MNIKNQLPNLLTSCNLLCGCLAIVEIFQGRLENVVFYVIAAGVFDFFDGFAARLFNSTSKIGKDLDSLADMVSFGVVPAFVLYAMINQAGAESFWAYSALLIAVLSAVRLAKFNNDPRQTDSFHGLPTPANALFCVSLPLLVQNGVLSNLLTHHIGLSLISILMSILLVTDIKLIALKFNGFGWAGNEVKFLLLLCFLLGIVLFQWVAIPFLILIYFFTSIFVNLLNANK